MSNPAGAPGRGDPEGTSGRGRPSRARRRAEPRRPVRAVLTDMFLGPFRTALGFPGGRVRLIRRLLVVNVVDASVLWVIAGPLPGVTVSSWPSAFAITVLAAVVSVLLRPVVLFAARRLGILAFLLTFLLNAVALLVSDRVVPGVRVDGLLPALGAAIGVAIGNTIVSWVLSLGEDDSFYGNLLKRLARARGLIDEATTPGLLVIQVDGLAMPILQTAIRTGRMPYLASLLRSGSHRLVEWRCRVPSMTSASQAGILLGASDDIPAFRWYEKGEERLVVSNHPADAAEMERRLGDRGTDLLIGGSSVSNLFAGGAARSVLTASTLEIEPDLLVGDRAASEFWAYLVNPYNVVRGLVLSIGMVILEWYQARRERIRGVRPRMNRGGAFPLLRAASSIILRDLATAAVIEDLQRGSPIVYVDLLNYDEIAHHAAPERGEAMRELEAVDRQVGIFVRGAEGAPRPYRMVLLSDHGQSVGDTFEDRTGLGLDRLVARLMAGRTTVGAAMSDAEGYGRVNMFLSAVVRRPGVGPRMARRALRRRMREGVVELGPTGRERARASERPEAVVCASGNLALVYLNVWPGRATYEEIAARYPSFVERLAATDGIGFVMVRSEARGALVIGSSGVRSLEDDSVQGDDPLAVFDPATADDLRRLDAMSRVGDLVVNSSYDPSTEEVASFEKLIGCHGGFGGPQTRPFLMVPADLDVGSGPIVGGEAVNAILRRAAAVGAADPPDALSAPDSPNGSRGPSAPEASTSTAEGPLDQAVQRLSAGPGAPSLPPWA
jgi:uncharacterized membrane protein YvlD (DUF360 family)